MIWLIAGLVVFLGIHSVRMVVPEFRNRQILSGGENRWKVIYSIASIAGFILLVWGYGKAWENNTLLYSTPSWLSHVQLLLMIPAMILLIASQLPAGRIKKTVKNPQLIAVKIWAIGHLLVNGDLASVLLFGAFLVWAVLLMINTNRRGLQFPELTDTRGDVLSIIVGLVVWAAFVFFLHEWLIGVPVFA